MKCARCDHDSKYSERPSRKCPKCNGLFAFEPRDGDPVTDMLFKNAIKAVSGDGRIRWGVENLYYEVCRGHKRGHRLQWVGAILLLLFAAAGASAFTGSLKFGALVFIVVALVSASKMWMTMKDAVFVPITAADFAKFWSRWCAAHGKPDGVIERRFARGSVAAPSPATSEADLGDYSFDRAVICDRARTVDLLVANNFHFENNCAILSIDGYPEGPFATIRAMLKCNPRLLAVVLHDATPAGCRLARKVAHDPEWFGAKLLVIDLGLRPNHAKSFTGVLLKAATVARPDDAITVSEAAWLSVHQLELAAIRPEEVLKRLYKGLQAHANDDVSSGGTSECGSFESSSSSDMSSDDGADSFG